MFRSIGVGELYFVVLWGLGLPIFCVWKFYQMLAKINENIAGLRRAVEGSGTTPLGSSAR
jgi:hypothetical protein